MLPTNPHLSETWRGRLRGAPPSGRHTHGARLRIAGDPEALAASRQRHPSSQLDAVAVCGACGFSSPARADTAEALRSLPTVWRSALQADRRLVDRAALLRDELHAVANRVARLLDEPGAHLSIVTIRTPMSTSGIPSTGTLVNGVRLAAERLARLVESLSADDWEATGLVPHGAVTISQLIRVPLHHSHRDLANGGGIGGTVVLLGGGRAFTTPTARVSAAAVDAAQSL
jgi:hypothetical protein